MLKVGETAGEAEAETERSGEDEVTPADFVGEALPGCRTNTTTRTNAIPDMAMHRMSTSDFSDREREENGLFGTSHLVTCQCNMLGSGGLQTLLGTSASQLNGFATLRYSCGSFRTGDWARKAHSEHNLAPPSTDGAATWSLTVGWLRHHHLFWYRVLTTGKTTLVPSRSSIGTVRLSVFLPGSRQKFRSSQPLAMGSDNQERRCWTQSCSPVLS